MTKTQARVCLIDDDIFVRDALALGLSDAGYDVLTAPGAAAGLDLVNRTPVDIIVTDLNMPGVNGAQLIGEARARWPHIPIIAITGASTHQGRNVIDVARELGAAACMVKPFRAAQLAATIQQHLGLPAAH